MSEWISVSERMPEALSWVLVADADADVWMAQRMPGYWAEAISTEALVDVTHWMPLPEPPK
jgi:hypothetical protein